MIAATPRAAGPLPQRRPGTPPRPHAPRAPRGRPGAPRRAPARAAAAAKQQQPQIAEAAAPPAHLPGRGPDNVLPIVGACLGVWAVSAAIAVGVGAALRAAGDTRYLRRSSSAAAWSSDWSCAAAVMEEIDRLPLPADLEAPDFCGERRAPAAAARGGPGGGAAPLAPAARPALEGGGAAALRIVAVEGGPSGEGGGEDSGGSDGSGAGGMPGTRGDATSK
ncbi:hypothetical protein Rsub_11388 [Raphidocelis subcapitata]|uniref:Uncharacterized protein n=1 Tax=Raphidocelis subcapitata TaxID=307507 RepID=A0A2V0PG87_9CHLO|nr:hypothetical protein Rsub_11388 [Raphidocelis subcapitata]|eukprot:GBF98806.1 hypothetical protein Rsub_11388 [Raphidocelis subcapitata]